jgi:hypothetical protein
MWKEMMAAQIARLVIDAHLNRISLVKRQSMTW